MWQGPRTIIPRGECRYSFEHRSQASLGSLSTSGREKLGIGCVVRFFLLDEEFKEGWVGAGCTALARLFQVIKTALSLPRVCSRSGARGVEMRIIERQWRETTADTKESHFSLNTTAIGPDNERARGDLRAGALRGDLHARSDGDMTALLQPSTRLEQQVVPQAERAWAKVRRNFFWWCRAAMASRLLTYCLLLCVLLSGVEEMDAARPKLGCLDTSDCPGEGHCMRSAFYYNYGWCLDVPTNSSLCDGTGDCPVANTTCYYGMCFPPNSVPIGHMCDGTGDCLGEDTHCIGGFCWLHVLAHDGVPESGGVPECYPCDGTGDCAGNGTYCHDTEDLYACVSPDNSCIDME